MPVKRSGRRDAGHGALRRARRQAVDIGRRRGFELARVVDGDAVEVELAPAGLVQVEQHPPGLALAATQVGQGVAQHLLGERGLAVGVQDGAFLDHRRAGRRGGGIGLVGQGDEFGLAMVVEYGAGGRRCRGAPGAAPARFGIVEKVGRHCQFDGVDLGGGGARDFALALAVDFKRQARVHRRRVGAPPASRPARVFSLRRKICPRHPVHHPAQRRLRALIHDGSMDPPAASCAHVRPRKAAAGER